MTEIKVKYPIKIEVVPVGQIDVIDRSRTDFGNIEELAQELLKNGLIHPPTVSIVENDPEYKYKLVGGERRFRAMKMLGMTEVPVAIRERLNAHEILEMELAENFHRKKMMWQEECVLIAKTHHAKVLAKALDMESWGTRETGALLGMSSAHVSHATTLAPLLIKGDAEVIACPSMYAAYELLLKRQENIAAALATKDINAVAERAAGLTGFIIVTDDVDEIFGNMNKVSTEFDASLLGDAIAPSTKLDFDLGALFRCGDCLELMPQMPEASIDHIAADPPYGIDLDMMPDMKNIDTVRDTHEIDQNISMFEPFLENAFRLLRPSGYCVFWYDISHHEKLQSLAVKIGFKPQRWPLVWHKLHPCLNNSPRCNFTKNVEFAMVLRKSSSAALVEPQNSCLTAADGFAERKLYDNPFAKPMAVWKFILSAIAYKGQIIFDPYAGQASCLRTVINMGMVPMGCEIDQSHYNKGILNLQKLIKEINGH